MNVALFPRPFGPALLVYVEPTSGEKLVNGIHVIESATEVPLIGYVLAVGDIPGVLPGNRVMFSKYAGTVVQLSGKEYHHLLLSDILLHWPETFPLPESLAPAVETPSVEMAELARV